MNSMPIVNEFENQWSFFRETIQVSNINLETVNELISALLKVTDSGGYGKIRISIVGGIVQELLVEHGSRPSKSILKDQIDTK